MSTVLLVLEQLDKVHKDLHNVDRDQIRGEVESYEAFLGVNLFVELKHFSKEFLVKNTSIFLVDVQGYLKASLNLYARAILRSEKCTTDVFFVNWSAEIVVQDIRHNSWVNAALERFHTKARVEVG